MGGRVLWAIITVLGAGTGMMRGPMVMAAACMLRCCHCARCCAAAACHTHGSMYMAKIGSASLTAFAWDPLPPATHWLAYRYARPAD